MAAKNPKKQLNSKNKSYSANKKKSYRHLKKRKKNQDKKTTFAIIGILASLTAIIYLAVNFTGIFKSNKENIVALVNNEQITLQELDWWYKISIQPDFKDKVKKEDFLMESLIPQKLLLQEAKKEKIAITNEEVENMFGQFLIDNGFSLTEFEEEIRKNDITIDDVKKSFEARLIITKFLNKTLFSGLESSEQLEIKNELFNKYLEELIKDSEIKIFLDNIVEDEKKIKAFKQTDDEICRENEKPIIRLYTTSFCRVCKKVGKDFDDIVKKYINEGQIVAYHWDIDIGDNLLTNKIENGTPRAEVNILKKYNPSSTVPTFVFGCKYVAVGSGISISELEEFIGKLTIT